jgi:hypothetical protein
MTDIDANVLAPEVIYETCRKLLVSIRNIRPVIGLVRTVASVDLGRTVLARLRFETQAWSLQTGNGNLTSVPPKFVDPFSCVLSVFKHRL